MTKKLLLVPAALLAFAACSAPAQIPAGSDQAACARFSNALHYVDPAKTSDRIEITRAASRTEDPELTQHHDAMIQGLEKRLPWGIAAYQFADRCDALFTNLMIDRDKL